TLYTTKVKNLDFNQPQRGRVFVFVGIPRFVLPLSHPPSRTHALLAYGQCPRIFLIRPSHQIPYPATGIAKAGEYTEGLVVGQSQRRASECTCAVEQRFVGSRKTRVP